jgi:hypothetical protein
MDVRGHLLPSYPAEMLDLQRELEAEEEKTAPDDIRLRGPIPLKEAMERIAELQARALKDFLKYRRGMSANRLWLMVAQNFRVAFIARFGPLPPRGDELAERQYAERVASGITDDQRKRK